MANWLNKIILFMNLKKTVILVIEFEYKVTLDQARYS